MFCLPFFTIIVNNLAIIFLYQKLIVFIYKFSSLIHIFYNFYISSRYFNLFWFLCIILLLLYGIFYILQCPHLYTFIWFCSLKPNIANFCLFWKFLFLQQLYNINLLCICKPFCNTDMWYPVIWYIFIIFLLLLCKCIIYPYRNIVQIPI